MPLPKLPTDPDWIVEREDEDGRLERNTKTGALRHINYRVKDPTKPDKVEVA